MYIRSEEQKKKDKINKRRSYLKNKELLTDERKQYLKEYRQAWRNLHKGGTEGKYSREYYHKNKEKVILYKESVKEQTKEYQKQWYIDNKDKIKDHRKEYAKEHYIKNKERLNMESLEWHLNNKDKIIHSNRVNNLKNYGLTIDGYNKMFSDQNGCCAVCGRHQSEFKKRLAVDHNHITKKVRKLLCNQCNTAIGLLNEDKNIIMNVIKYLEEHND